jgi:hypothetical protein
MHFRNDAKKMQSQKDAEKMQSQKDAEKMQSQKDAEKMQSQKDANLHPLPFFPREPTTYPISNAKEL